MYYKSVMTVYLEVSTISYLLERVLGALSDGIEF